MEPGPEYRSCIAANNQAIYQIDRDGTILNVALFWPLDTSGGARLTSLMTELDSKFQRLQQGNDSIHSLTTIWKADSVCHVIFPDSDQHQVYYGRVLWSERRGC